MIRFARQRYDRQHDSFQCFYVVFGTRVSAVKLCLQNITLKVLCQDKDEDVKHKDNHRDADGCGDEDGNDLCNCVSLCLLLDMCTIICAIVPGGICICETRYTVHVIQCMYTVPERRVFPFLTVRRVCPFFKTDYKHTTTHKHTHTHTQQTKTQQTKTPTHDTRKATNSIPQFTRR